MRARIRRLAILFAAGAAQVSLAWAQLPIDYSLAPSRDAPALRLTPGMALGGEGSAGVALQAGSSWFGQVGVTQGPVSPLARPGTNDVFSLAGGYKFGGGQALSLQLSRSAGPGQHLGLAVNYDWPRYFVRFSYDPQRLTLTPQESLRVSAGLRF